MAIPLSPLRTRHWTRRVKAKGNYYLICTCLGLGASFPQVFGSRIDVDPDAESVPSRRVPGMSSLTQISCACFGVAGALIPSLRSPRTISVNVRALVNFRFA